ncbi:hypothetical protein GQ457_09G017870 [Hibiscus cannabinus]
MVTRKKRIEEFETAAGTETCLALMHNKVPAKKTDPGSFTIECFIGHNYRTKALCDPGASINLMPKSVFQKLGIGEAKPTTVILQPFLSTSRAVIDFDNDEIIFKVENNSVKVKSLTKKLKKGKNIAETPAKDTPRLKLYMGAHVERDRAVIINGEAQKEEEEKAQGICPTKACPSRKYLRQIFYSWQQLANYNWVIEFYANNAAGEDFSTVRGRRVPATAATINAILGLPNNEPSFYAMLGGFEEEDYEVIKDFLCKPNTEWNTTGGNPNSVSRLSLLSEINVGEILAKELAAACANDKGILAFPCLISALCRRAAVPIHDGDKYQPEKTGWTRAVYMRKMDVADAAPLNVAMPTPPSSPIPEAAIPDEAGPSAPAAPAEPRQTPPASPPVVPISSHTTTPAAQEHSRASTPDTHLGSTPSSSPSPPAPAQSEEVAPPLHIMQLRSQLQRIEARHIHFQEEMKSPRDHLQPLGPITTTPAPGVPILSAAPTPTTYVVAERPTLDSPARRKGKATAGRTFGRDIPSSLEDEADQRPAKRRRKYHVITADSDDA